MGNFILVEKERGEKFLFFIFSKVALEFMGKILQKILVGEAKIDYIFDVAKTYN